MMERVVNPDAGTAPLAQVPGYVVAGKTGTAQRVGPKCGCYNGQFTVSFAGFAPADNPRFTVYVVVQRPRGRWRRLGGRPGVQQDHVLRAAPLRRTADGGEALGDPHDVVTLRDASSVGWPRLADSLGPT